jgi:hypothetical protein
MASALREWLVSPVLRVAELKASARMSPPSGPLVVQTLTPAETGEAERAMPTRVTKGRERLMRLCVAFLMVSLLRDNQNAAKCGKSLEKH